MIDRTRLVISIGVCILLAGVLLPAQSRKALDAGRAREILRHIGGGNLPRSQVRVIQVSQGLTGSDAIVEAQIETAYRFTRTDEGWQIADIRLGHEQWESYELVREAVRREKIRRTTALMQQLADGLEAYRRERGGYPAADDLTKMLDELAPRYVPADLRHDLWARPFIYRRGTAGYELISSGPDQQAGTGDDLLMENGRIMQP